MHPASQAAASTGRPACSAARTPVTTNGDEEDPFVDGRRPIESIAAERDRAARVAGQQGDLGEAPQRREDQLDLARS